jgi:hypothetical protein
MSSVMTGLFCFLLSNTPVSKKFSINISFSAQFTPFERRVLIVFQFRNFFSSVLGEMRVYLSDVNIFTSF